MGGLETEISSGSQHILIESARFDSISVRNTSRELGLFSPSSHRFERPMDPEKTDWASRRCVELILDLAGGEMAEGVIELGGGKRQRQPIALRLSQIERVLGISVPQSTVTEIMNRLGLQGGDTTDVGVSTWAAPSWRSDLDREIDLIEEVARVYGYEHIPEDKPVPLAIASRSRRERVETGIRETLTGQGLYEAVTYSLISEELSKPIHGDLMDGAVPIRLEHSSRKKETTLRPSLAGRFQLLGLLETRLSTSPVWSILDPLASAELYLGGRRWGVFGNMTKEAQQAKGLRLPCAILELDLAPLIDQAQLQPQYRKLPDQPGVTRDLSLVVPDSVRWADIAQVARQSGGPLLENVEFLDTFRGGNLAAGTQSLHFGMTFRDAERTLSGEEADQAVGEIIRSCSESFGATLRS